MVGHRPIAGSHCVSTCGRRRSAGSSRRVPSRSASDRVPPGPFARDVRRSICGVPVQRRNWHRRSATSCAGRTSPRRSSRHRPWSIALMGTTPPRRRGKPPRELHDGIDCPRERHQIENVQAGLRRPHDRVAATGLFRHAGTTVRRTLLSRAANEFVTASTWQSWSAGGERRCQRAHDDHGQA
jgi:hypothetical protein